ncbi:regulator of sigma E protease [Trypanosoma cruzi]|nr:regulator of sigma E protease [Trypanosoma cruzi]
MAPVTGRPSSSVAHGSAYTPPSAAATCSTVSESATPVEQCPAGAVNQLQTLPVASGGTINGPSSGRTSKRSTFSYTAAGIASSSRMLPCAKNRTLSSQSNAPSKEFTVQRQKNPRCFLLSSESLVDTLMRTATRRSFPKPLSTRDASCALRGMSLTIRRINHAPSDVSQRQKKKDTSR